MLVAGLLGLVALALLPALGRGGAAAQAGPSLPYRTYVAGLAADGQLPPPPPASTIIGASVQGRAIEASTVGQGGTRLVIIGGLHAGGEVETISLVQQLRTHYATHADDLPPDIQLVFIPIANPDGYAAGTRTNANGVDLNRNWPSANWRSEAVVNDVPISGGPAPLSEPETQALHAYLLALQPVLVVTFHAYAGSVEANELPFAQSAATQYATIAGYDYIEEWTDYEITGQLIDEMEEQAIPAFDVELGLIDPDGFTRNRPAIDALITTLTAP